MNCIIIGCKKYLIYQNCQMKKIYLVLVIVTLVNSIEESANGDLCTLGKRQSPIQILDSKLRTDRMSSYKIQWLMAEVRYNPYKNHSLYFQGNISRILLERKNLPSQIFESHEFILYVPAEHKLTTIHPDVEMQIIHTNSKGDILIYCILFVKSIVQTNPNSIVSRLKFLKNKQFGYYLNTTKELRTNSFSYSYMGSLNHAPCTENVRYIVKKQMILLSEYEYNILLARSLEKTIPKRRGIQKLNDREIIQSMVRYEASGLSKYKRLQQNQGEL